MTLRLEVCDNEERWENLLSKCPHRTIFHTWRWLKVVEESTGMKLFPLIGFIGTTPVSLYPLFLHDTRFIKIVYSPPPKTGMLYLGPLYVDYDKLKQNKRESLAVDLQRTVDTYLFKELKAAYVRIRTSPYFIDSRHLKWCGYFVEPYYTYILDMQGGMEKVWEGFNSQVRKDIKKTEREGVSVEETGKEGIAVINQLMHKRFKEQGLEFNINLKYLERLYDLFNPQNLRVFITKYRDECIGGMILLYYDHRAYVWTGIPKSDKKGLSPNDLMHWKLMQQAYKDGCRYYEIMCAGDDPRLRHAKSKFNPDLCIWYSSEKYSSPFYCLMKKGLLGLYRRVRR